MIRVIGEPTTRRQARGYFHRSLVTQAYLEELLILKEGFVPKKLRCSGGTMSPQRAAEALRHRQDEVGDFLQPHQRPSRSVALRLALVHEFRTSSRIYISTEAGARASTSGSATQSLTMICHGIHSVSSNASADVTGTVSSTT